MKQILLADDHELIRMSVREVLELVPDWSVCGEAREGQEAVAMAARLHPDVAVIDLQMPGLNGVEVARRIRGEVSPGTQVLVLTGNDSEELLWDACEAGARACVLKADGTAHLIAGVEAVMEGRSFFSPGARLPTSAVGPTGAPLPRRGRCQVPNAPSALTPREVEILQLLANGKTNWCVATILGISTKTVETHRAHIMQKVGCESIVELVRYAVRNLMVTP